jgi:hypothetical protein
MFKLSKKVEYGLIAVKHMAMLGMESPCSAKEISEKYKISYDLLSKILQKLKKESILTSVQGTRGGYILSQKPEKLSLGDGNRSQSCFFVTSGRHFCGGRFRFMRIDSGRPADKGEVDQCCAAGFANGCGDVCISWVQFL